MGREGLRPQAGGRRLEVSTADSASEVPGANMGLPTGWAPGTARKFQESGISILPVPSLLKGGGVNLWSVPECPQGLPPLGSC